MNTIKKESINQITVDIDEKYDDFMDGHHFLEIRKRVYDQLSPLSAKREIRRSSGDHVHIRITFYREITLFESLCIRAFLDDDPVRLACDLTRYYRTGAIENTGRCFDEKYTKGQTRKAGAWWSF